MIVVHIQNTSTVPRLVLTVDISSTVRRDDVGRGHVRVGSQGGADGALAPGLLRVHHLQGAPGRPGVLLEGGSPVLREASRRDPQAEVFSLRRERRRAAAPRLANLDATPALSAPAAFICADPSYLD
ncbi:hypothetical protein EVAR_81729_1 [Eumeta japonica]|uniref:Uncharacterized protein n=1 Tax=Eumeta variegata TaxID=151549 RepID=A0A4C1UHQ5_EUMVA|nr:hypothetical protein EVAR_81729_1 [Eumeta japonica]